MTNTERSESRSKMYVKLTDGDMDVIIGGKIKSQIMRVACQFCHEPFDADILKDTAVCPHCKETNTFYG